MRAWVWLKLSGLVLSLALVAGCNSSSSGGGSNSAGDGNGGGDNGEPTEVTAFEGVVLAPGGELVRLERPALERLLAMLVKNAGAEMVGLSPVQGIEVELIRVDSDGNPVGEPIATGTTTSTGNYTLRLSGDLGIEPSADLVIRAVGLTQELRAQAVSDTVTVDPVSEFVLRKLIDFKVPLDHLETADVVRIRGNVDALGIDAGSEGLGSAFAALEAAAGAYLDSEAETVAAAPASHLEPVLGDWYLAAVRFEMGWRHGGVGTLGLFSESVGLALEDVDGALGVRGGVVDGLVLFWEQSVGPDWAHLYGPEVEVEPAGEEPAVTGIVNLLDDLSLFVASGIEEWADTEDDFASRRLTETERFRYAGEHLRVGVVRSFEQLYGALEDDQLDASDFRGERRSTELTILGRPPATLNPADVQGNYGLVQLRMSMDERFFGVAGYVMTADFDGTDTIALQEDALEVEHWYGEPPELHAMNEADSIAYAVDGNRLVVDGAVSFNVTADHGALFAALQSRNLAGDSLVDPDEPWAVEEGLLLGVKLPDHQPDMDGRRYRLQAMSIQMAGAGAMELKTRQSGELVFQGGNVALENERLQLLSRDTPRSAPGFEALGDGGDGDWIPYTLDASGGISVAHGDTRFDGFVSADGDVLVLRKFTEAASDDDYTLGMWIGVRVAD
ncbi:MAG: hypothetical protein JJT90_03885 [Ectothiorhodospiraceae bacterium]|nr:hypothetical protein [Ectothiorhodospiraceae bacterium]